MSKGAGGFAGGVFALSGGSMVSHLLAFACLPILTRLFAPEAFGAAEAFLAIMMVIGVVASLRYEAALMLPESDAEAANLLGICCTAVVVVTGLTFVAAALFGDAMSDHLNVAMLGRYKWLLPVGVFTWGLSLPLRAWCRRNRRFRQIAALSVGETFTSVSSRIAAGAGGLAGPGTLVLTSIAARAVPTLGMLYKLLRHDAAFIISHCKRREMVRMGRRYVRFPLIDIWSAFLRQVSYYLPVVLLAASLGAEVAGFYKLAVLCVQLPLLLVGNAIGEVFFQRAAEGRAGGAEITELVEGVLERLIWISFLPMAVVALIGPDLFSVVLGARWEEAGLYARILTGSLFLVGIATPLWALISVLDRLGGGLAFQGALVGAQIAALIVGGWVVRDPRTSIVLLGITGAVVNAAVCGYLLSAARVSLVRAGGWFLRYLLYALPTLAVGTAAKWWWKLPTREVVAVVAVASVSYCVLVLRHDRWARSLVVGSILRILRRGGA